MAELSFDEAAKITLKLRKHQYRMEWLSLLFGQMLERAKEKRIWISMDYDSWDRYCVEELNIGGDSEANDLIRIAQLIRQFPEHRKIILTIGKSKMRLLLPHVGQNFETNEFEIDTDELGDLLEKAHTMTWLALRNNLNDTPEQESQRTAPLPLSVTVPIPSNGEPHDYQVELNQRTGEVLRVVDLNPIQGRCVEEVGCVHCGAKNWVRVSRPTEIIAVYENEPRGEE